MHREIDRIDSKAVDAAVEPEARDVEKRILHRWTVDVQIRLLGQEIVQIILPAARVPLPGRSTEYRLPVIRRRAVGLRVRPNIPIGLGIRSA